MRMSIAAAMVLALVGTGVARDDPGLDGIWRFRERFCIRTDGGRRRCGRGAEQFMLAAGIAYYGGSSGSSWTEVGTVPRSTGWSRSPSRPRASPI